ncbi:Glucose-6-phosphate 1-dehydrogenase [Nymphon striatum]|nr:Glucose-6-phosphate 1-dehydrogenase [Nymphon striatum]
MTKTENQMLIIFGASGDLTARKLVPALFRLFQENQLPKNFVVLGVSRSYMTDDEFRKKVVSGNEYLKGNHSVDDSINVGTEYDTDYKDLEERITTLNANIFEPLWNRNYIDRVEITNAESGGVGLRGGYYDGSGALRDMFQNHLLQIVSLIVMEPPIDANAQEIRNEKVKALRSLRIMHDEKTLSEHTIRAQYVSSKIDGKVVNGYREEEGVNPESTTETYAAIKFFVDNWRWKDVPFYVRTAKRMPTKVTEVVIHFKAPHHQIFKDAGMFNKDNKLIIRIQPDEGILIKFGVKVPGQGFKVERANLDFYYSSLVDTSIMEAYERLLLDAMQGDATLYARADEVEAAWEFVDPILKYWKNGKDVRVYGYSAGAWGPENADALIAGDGLWRNPGPNLADDPGFCRCVDPTDDDSNYKMTVEYLISKIEIPKENIHRIKGENEPDYEAKRYAELLDDNLAKIRWRSAKF